MRPTRALLVTGLGLAAAALLSFGGCTEKKVPNQTPSSTAAPEPDAVYVVRGKVAMLPDPADPRTEFRVHHEAIPDFKGPDGQVIKDPDGKPIGMREMIMMFPYGDPKILEGLAVGDIVEITFADWYKPLRNYKVTKIVKLPADTKLNLKDE